MKKGFTLIESLAVIAIIGILAALSIYMVAGIMKNSRDAKRKSDLTAISLGFQARYEAKTCSNQAEDVGFYPGRTLGQTVRWKEVEQLRTTTDSCGSFSEFLATVPVNPEDSSGVFPYRFDLSNESGLVGKHYRLAAKLEKTSVNQEAELVRARTIWHDSFGGNLTDLRVEYNYIIGN